MSLFTVDLNDSEIRLAKDDRILVRSEGYALVESHGVAVGSDAAAQAHLHPRQINNRFWQRLNQTPLGQATKFVRHNADLAYHHLAELLKQGGSPKEIVFAVPGNYTNDQLSLLLGIANACKTKTMGIVDAAVAAAAASVPPGNYRHIEIQLHQTLLTELQVDERVTRKRVEVVDEAGLVKLHSAFVHRIADRFLSQSRFDPLHHAGSEQLLYNELPKWLSLLGQRAEIRIQVEFRGSRYEARVTRDDMIEVAKPVYAEIFSRLAADEYCLLGDRLSQLPGISARLRRYAVLAEDSLIRGCVQNQTAVCTNAESLNLVTSLPVSGAPSLDIAPLPTIVAGVAVADTGSATHILCDCYAFPIAATELFLDSAGRGSSRRTDHTVASINRNGSGVWMGVENAAALKLNGSAVDKAVRIRPGDRITIEGAGCVFTPISVVATDGA